MKAAKVWGTSTRNKKSIKKEQHVIKVVDADKYHEPAYFLILSYISLFNSYEYKNIN